MLIESIVVVVDCTAEERDKILEYGGPSLTSDRGDMLVEVEDPLDLEVFPERHKVKLCRHIENDGIRKILVVGG